MTSWLLNMKSLPFLLVLIVAESLSGDFSRVFHPKSAPNTRTSVRNENTRIVGGEAANPGEFPWIVSLQLGFFLIIYEHICGAAILNENWVLTAGHCITETQGLGIYVVKAGLTLLDDPNHQSCIVNQTIVHPDYQGGVGPNDVAVLRLTQPLVFGDLVKPIALPNPSYVAAGNSSLAGWGLTNYSDSDLPNNLQKINLPILTYEECAEALVDLLGTSFPLNQTSNICTGPLDGGKSICNGDSGSPLIQTVDGSATAVGIVSWEVTPCGVQGAPSVYTNVAPFVDFIGQNINS